MRGMFNVRMIRRSAARERARASLAIAGFDRCQSRRFFSAAAISRRTVPSHPRSELLPVSHSEERKKIAHDPTSNVAKVRGFARACGRSTAGRRRAALERFHFPTQFFSARAEDGAKRPDRRWLVPSHACRARTILSSFSHVTSSVVARRIAARFRRRAGRRDANNTYAV